jgi:anti-anti-sigma factor
VSGDVDLETFGLLEAPLQTLQLDGRSNIVVDLSGIGFIDSTGVRVIVEAHRRAVVRGRTLLIRGAPEQVLRLFQLTATDRELTVEADLGTAC